MKKMITIIIFIFLFLPLHAPEYHYLYFQESEGIRVFDKMLYAFEKVESDFNCDTVNSCNAGGILQITPKMIAECNRITKLLKIPFRCVLSDRLDSLKSVQIWYIVQNYWNLGYDLKRACKIWNPKGDKRYYIRILKNIRI